jgi:hypothetical protein
MKLTREAVARYRPPQGKADHIIFDEDLSGFGLRYRDGKRTWIYQYAFGSGEERVNARMTLGEYPALPPAKARSQARGLICQGSAWSAPRIRQEKNQKRCAPYVWEACGRLS